MTQRQTVTWRSPSLNYAVLEKYRKIWGGWLSVLQVTGYREHTIFHCLRWIWDGGTITREHSLHYAHQQQELRQAAANTDLHHEEEGVQREGAKENPKMIDLFATKMSRLKGQFLGKSQKEGFQSVYCKETSTLPPWVTLKSFPPQKTWFLSWFEE